MFSFPREYEKLVESLTALSETGYMFAINTHEQNEKKYVFFHLCADMQKKNYFYIAEKNQFC